MVATKRGFSVHRFKDGLSTRTKGTNMPITAIKHHGDNYHSGGRLRTYRRALRYAAKRGYRVMSIVHPGTGTLINYVDVYMSH